MKTTLDLSAPRQRKPRPYIQSSKWMHRKGKQPKLRIRVVTADGRRQLTTTIVNKNDRTYLAKAFLSHVSKR